VFTGKHTKELIERAEFQLGVTGTGGSGPRPG
jgi:hypothetical protein